MEVADGKKFAAYMKGVRNRTLEVFSACSFDRAHWRLSDDSMTPVGILLHIGAVERALWGAGLKNGSVIQLDEPDESQHSPDDALNFLAGIRKNSEGFWRALSPADLESEIITPTGQRRMLKRWLVLAAEHEIHHRSFLHAYRKIWGMQSHPIYGLTLPQLRQNLSKIPDPQASL